MRGDKGSLQLLIQSLQFCRAFDHTRYFTLHPQRSYNSLTDIPTIPRILVIYSLCKLLMLSSILSTAFRLRVSDSINVYKTNSDT
jgi:hypothetical protein